jgi:hypothetical protein
MNINFLICLTQARTRFYYIHEFFNNVFYPTIATELSSGALRRCGAAAPVTAGVLKRLLEIKAKTQLTLTNVPQTFP